MKVKHWIWIIVSGVCLTAAMAVAGLYVFSRGAKGLGVTRTVVVIERPGSEVFDALNQAEIIKQWRSGIVEAKVVGESEIKTGLKHHYWLVEDDRRVEERAELTSLEGRDKWVWRHNSPDYRTVSKYYLEEVDEGTKVTLLRTTQYKREWMKWLEPLITRLKRSENEGDLVRLKQFLESNNRDGFEKVLSHY